MTHQPRMTFTRAGTRVEIPDGLKTLPPKVTEWAFLNNYTGWYDLKVYVSNGKAVFAI